MPRPSEVYRDGYEKGQKDNIAGNLGEVMTGILRDDPGGHFAAGYRDGGAGKKLSPPSDTTPKPHSTQRKESTASDLEKEWYRLCNGTDFIPKETVHRYVSALRAEGSHVAIVVGLSDLTGQLPRCGSEGQFKIHFLGSPTPRPMRLEWLHGNRLLHRPPNSSGLPHRHSRGKAMKEEADKKPDKSGNWIYGVLGFLFAAVFRTAAACCAYSAAYHRGSLSGSTSQGRHRDAR